MTRHSLWNEVRVIRDQLANRGEIEAARALRAAGERADIGGTPIPLVECIDRLLAGVAAGSDLVAGLSALRRLVSEEWDRNVPARGAVVKL